MTSLFDPQLHHVLCDYRQRVIDHIDSGLASQGQDENIALFIFEVSNIFQINARYGYSCGDKALYQLFQRLELSVKRSSLIVRLDGERHAMVVPGIKSDKLLPVTAERLNSLLSEPFEFDGLSIELSVSSGVVMSPFCGKNGEDSFLMAERALRFALEKGRAYFIAHDAMRERPVPVLSRGVLDLAVAQGEFSFHYQPKVDIQTGIPTNSEALIRWVRTSSGLVPTEQFIAMAEQGGLIYQITAWALKAVVRESRSLAYKGQPLGVAINISATDIYQEGLVDSIDSTLAIWNILPELLTIEVTEGALLEDPERCIQVLNAVRERGIRVSIDDFGTGYSSLSYFKRIPADELKIDKSFVLNLDKSSEDQSIVETVIGLAHKFNMRVVAEGVENIESLRILKEMGCDYAQGYFFSKPCSREDFSIWLDSYQADIYFGEL